VIEPFEIAVPDEVLVDLRDRLRRTRWPQHLEGTGWSYGTDPAYLRELVQYWSECFDWRAQERRLNAFAHFRAEVGGLRVHFVRAPGVGASPIPILLLHGWPGSFVQMLDLVPLLAAPEHPADSLDVIAASLPGFGFSDPASTPGMSDVRMADLFHDLMTDVLGYTRYAVHGTDFGAGVANQLIARHPEALVGAHVGGTSPRAEGIDDRDSPALQRYAEDVARWRREEVGYGAIQSTKPHTLAAALNDSPAGLASWLVEKFRRWSDCEGNVEQRFTKDQLLTNVMTYWVTGTIGSSIRLYRESAPDPDLRNSPVPMAHLMSDRDMLHTPREWVERTNRVDRWTQIDRGGHFIEWEEPDLVADDILEFLRPLRPPVGASADRSAGQHEATA
jgi:pimeloyl-ACP methyl ester carboxylesterase